MLDLNGPGSFCLYVRGKDHFFGPLSEVPAFDYIIAVVFVLDHYIGKSRVAQKTPKFLHGNRACYSTAVGVFIIFDFFGELTFF